MELREWLVKLRELKGLTQKEVASRAGISRSYYSGIEVGTRNTKPDVAQNIGEVLGFDWTLFFTQKRRETSRNKTA